MAWNRTSGHAGLFLPLVLGPLLGSKADVTVRVRWGRREVRHLAVVMCGGRTIALHAPPGRRPSWEEGGVGEDAWESPPDPPGRRWERPWSGTGMLLGLRAGRG